MGIEVSENIIDTVCNSLRASKQDLKRQLLKADTETKREVIKQQLAEVDEALRAFEQI